MHNRFPEYCAGLKLPVITARSTWRRGFASSALFAGFFVTAILFAHLTLEAMVRESEYRENIYQSRCAGAWQGTAYCEGNN